MLLAVPTVWASVEGSASTVFSAFPDTVFTSRELFRLEGEDD